jgi:hypothetical protein
MKTGKEYIGLRKKFVEKKTGRILTGVVVSVGLLFGKHYNPVYEMPKNEVAKLGPVLFNEMPRKISTYIYAMYREYTRMEQVVHVRQDIFELCFA